jgi:hypothetical protein
VWGLGRTKYLTRQSPQSQGPRLQGSSGVWGRRQYLHLAFLKYISISNINNIYFVGMAREKIYNLKIYYNITSLITLIIWPTFNLLPYYPFLPSRKIFTSNPRSLLLFLLPCGSPTGQHPGTPSVHTADIPRHPHTLLASFADDKAILSSQQDPNIHQNLQDHLTSVEE